MGMWNALGGHVEQGETPSFAAIREIKEESGITVKEVELYSISTWNYDDDEIYVYLTNLEEDFDLSIYPMKIDEGIVDFKDIDWIINSKNYGTIDDLRIFLNDIKEQKKQNYHLIYEDSKLVNYLIKEDLNEKD